MITTDAASSRVGHGPVAYKNWKRMLANEPLNDTYEYPLYSDAWFVGQQRYGPYYFLNPIHHGGSRSNGTRPALYLRVAGFLEFQLPDMEKTQYDQYHGGYQQDEVAALASLCLGVRLQAGEATRQLPPSASVSDPMGQPMENRSRPDPVLPRQRYLYPIVPQLLGKRDLSDLGQLDSLPSLPPEAATALVKAARQYQRALWIAESQPENAWIALVSSIETAAKQWKASSGTLESRFRDWKPCLAQLLQKKGGEDLVSRVATELKDQYQATAKFKGFVLHYLPDPPSTRPEIAFQHPWDKQSIRKSMDQIYSYRSAALHGSIQFPLPMCFPPRQGEEKPSGVAMSEGMSVWTVKDTPMLLHVFEYIVRKALLGWWRDSVPQCGRSQPDNTDENRDT